MEDTTSRGDTDGVVSDALADPREAGTLLLKKGQFAEAAAVLREAVAADPSDENAWGLLGGALASKGDYDGAIEAFSRAAALLPTLPRNHYNLGLAYESVGRLAEARASLEKAVNLDPRYEQARTRLGEVTQRLNPHAGAPVAAEGHTNIGGGGNATGLASIGAAQAPPVSTEGHTNISGGANTTGLSDVGAARSPAPAAPEGHTNIGGGSGMTSGLSGVGVGGNAPARNEGHTNIGGADSRGLGSVGTPVLRPTDAPAPPPPSAAPAYGTGTAYAPPPVLGMQYGADENNSGMKTEPVPSSVAGGWNWGAFFFSWLWLFNHRLVGWGLGFLVADIGSFLLPFLGLIFLAGRIFLGVKGNELGWLNRRFESVEDFKACQRTWAFWCLWVILGFFAIAILAALLYPIFAQARYRARGF